jgi:uncharacterized protein YndB with AHSA1/START domain
LDTPVRPTCFLIADISGYTSYLAGVELDHANDILTDLLETIVTALRPGFRLSRIEGDAAFMFSVAETLDGSVLLDTIEHCYFGFRRRRRDVRQATSCECDACRRIPNLDLKFVVHHGPALLQEVAGRQELLGLDAIIVHRLLKNRVVDQLGMSAYALFSQHCADAATLDPHALGMQPHVESYEGIGEIAAWAHDLERRWGEEDMRARVRVEPDASILTVTTTTSAPPQVAWAFLTTPGQRMSWQPWVTSVTVEGATGGRRSVGSANHCMHGADAVVEEILDWRPYDYVTDRTTLNTPSGPVRLLHTVELEPTTDGTTVHFRFAPPDNEHEQAIARQIAPAYAEALGAQMPTLAAQLDDAHASVTTDPG